MGCDGGTIPRRYEMVKEKARPERPDADAKNQAQSTLCQLSNEPLEPPVCACDLGNLYNRAALLEHLIAKTMPESLSHLRSIKDVFAVTLTPSTKDSTTGPFICPITLTELSGRHRFVALRPCGCVLSERVLKELPSPPCPHCGKPFSLDDDVIVLAPDEEALKKAKERLVERHTREKSAKKEKKKKEGGEKDREPPLPEKEEEKEKEPKDRGKRKAETKPAGQPPGKRTVGATAKAKVESVSRAPVGHLKPEGAQEDVWNSLFHSDKEKAPSGTNELFMGTYRSKFSAGFT